MTESALIFAPVRLGVPRHLQDCNGYCGPACVMMVHSSGAATVEAQHEMFRRVRDHAKQAGDRRPVKSPAESLLTLLNSQSRTWEKMFRTEPEPVAARIVQAVENAGQPCLLLVSRGMHWVVAFGRTRRDDGTVAGVLLRDPAWAGMPKFFGLTVLPEKPTFIHSPHAPCNCLASNNPPGSVHERYFSLEELLSPRGLQGSPDWEGKGALALVPAESAAARTADLQSAPANPGTTGPAGESGPPGSPGAPPPDPGTAALQQTRDHGLWGRADSPPEWQAALAGGTAGQPILVKDPQDARDDFYLVPIHPAAPGLRSAWVMLDVVTLRLREASLLDHWATPAFPTDSDADKLTTQQVLLPDGTRHRFQKSSLRPNQRNLVWQASAASILPYWPVKEFTAAHPVTGECVALYVTQHGEIYTALSAEDAPPEPPPARPAVSSKLPVTVLCSIAAAALGYWVAGKSAPPAPATNDEALTKSVQSLGQKLAESDKDRHTWQMTETKLREEIATQKKTATDTSAKLTERAQQLQAAQEEVGRARAREQKLKVVIEKLQAEPPRPDQSQPPTPAPAPPRPAPAPAPRDR